MPERLVRFETRFFIDLAFISIIPLSYRFSVNTAVVFNNILEEKKVIYFHYLVDISFRDVEKCLVVIFVDFPNNNPNNNKVKVDAI